MTCAARNYLAPSGSEAFPVLITSTLDETVKSKLRAGARVILIASDPLTLAPGIEVVPRAKMTSAAIGFPISFGCAKVKRRSPKLDSIR